MQESHASAVAAAAAAAASAASVSANARAVEHSSDDEVDPKPRNGSGLTNGIIKNTSNNNNNKGGRRVSGSTGKQLKKRRSQSQSQNAVATPPHSPTPTMTGSTERSSEASGSRSTSPERERERERSGTGLEAFTLANGDIKPELLPLSPAPSVRNGASTRTGSAASEPDSNLGMDDYSSIAPSVAGTGAGAGAGGPATALRAEKASQTVRSGRLRESVSLLLVA